MVVVGGGGTRYDCFGGDVLSLRSTFTYVSRASPRECSGSQAKRREEAAREAEVVDEEEVGRAGFCWRRAI